MKHLKSFNEKLTSEERKKNKMFRAAVWKYIPKEDQDILVSLYGGLSELRSELRYYQTRRYDNSDTKNKIKETLKKIKQIENKYYDKYKDMYNVFTNPVLANVNDKIGIFENKVNKKENN